MIKEGVKKSTYKKTKDATLQDLKKFQDFLCRKLYTYKHYQSMYPHNNQPAKHAEQPKDTNLTTFRKLKKKIKLLPYYRPNKNTQLQCITNKLTVLKTTLQKRVYNK